LSSQCIVRSVAAQHLNLSWKASVQLDLTPAFQSISQTFGLSAHNPSCSVGSRLRVPFEPKGLPISI